MVKKDKILGTVDIGENVSKRGCNFLVNYDWTIWSNERLIMKISKEKDLKVH